MSDRERARFFLAGLARAEALGMARYLDATDSLAADYAEVRRLEREAIVAWLRRVALEAGQREMFEVLATASNDVERGVHLEPPQ